MFDVVVDIWDNQLAARRERERRLQEEFKYRTKEHELETEEERNEKLFKESFPDYHAEFNDIISERDENMDVQDVIEERGAGQKDNHVVGNLDEEDTSVLEPSDMVSLFSCHRLLFCGSDRGTLPFQKYRSVCICNWHRTKCNHFDRIITGNTLVITRSMR
tara:strand:- start:307 stop:789 length:483 start_codon:yes stop_codon:yes gene_type:complete